jgi:hypothetical protein
MIQFDENLFGEEIFAKVPEADKPVILGQLFITLELRVGERIADELNEEQLEVFAQLDGDDAKRQAWLDEAVPTLPAIIAEEVKILRSEVKDIAIRAHMTPKTEQ